MRAACDGIGGDSSRTPCDPISRDLKSAWSASAGGG